MWCMMLLLRSSWGEDCTSVCLADPISEHLMSDNATHKNRDTIPVKKTSQLEPKGERVRIVSLLASATEMVAALGCLDQLVGRSHECDYPPEVLALPVVSKVQINVDGSSAEIDAQIKALAE